MPDSSEEWTQIAGQDSNDRNVGLRLGAPMGMHRRFVRHVSFEPDEMSDLSVNLTRIRQVKLDLSERTPPGFYP